MSIIQKAVQSHSERHAEAKPVEPRIENPVVAKAPNRRPDTPAAFMPLVANGFLQPGMEMITKPFDLDNLSRRVREMVGQSSSSGKQV